MVRYILSIQISLDSKPVNEIIAATCAGEKFIYNLPIEALQNAEEQSCNPEKEYSIFSLDFKTVKKCSYRMLPFVGEIATEEPIISEISFFM